MQTSHTHVILVQSSLNACYVFFLPWQRFSFSGCVRSLDSSIALLGPCLDLVHAPQELLLEKELAFQECWAAETRPHP